MSHAAAAPRRATRRSRTPAAKARGVQCLPVMQLFVEPRDSGSRDVPEDQQIDSATLRILASWIVRRAERDPELGASIERGFVMAQARD
jgi:hypothetical protein